MKTIEGRKCMSNDEFLKWVETVNIECHSYCSEHNLKLTVISKDGKYCFILIDFDTSAVFTNFCKKNEKFAIAVSFTKYMGKPIPFIGESTEIGSLTFGQRFWNIIDGKQYKFAGYRNGEYLAANSNGELICIYNGKNRFPVYLKGSDPVETIETL